MYVPGAVLAVAVIVVLLFPPPADSATEQVVILEAARGSPRVALGTDRETGVAYVQLSGRGIPTFPTIDITCNRRRSTIPLTKSQDAAGHRTVALYEVSEDRVNAMLSALECRLFLPGQEIALTRQQLWAAWGDSKGTEAPKVLKTRVVQVIDGDTIKVMLGDRMETVRYIGINTPETNHPTRGMEPGGREATEVNRMLVAGQQIRLELDVQERDRYGRLLAYVYVGDQMVNAELVRRGYAQVMTIPPNVRCAFRSS